MQAKLEHVGKLLTHEASHTCSARREPFPLTILIVALAGGTGIVRAQRRRPMIGVACRGVVTRVLDRTLGAHRELMERSCEVGRAGHGDWDQA